MSSTTDQAPGLTSALPDPGPGLGIASLRGFRPDVQALRGLAVLLVVLYHAEVVAPGGFVGVDVFFVISGFVIGRRLVARMATPGAPIMASFYMHRARRILPALAVTLAVVILLAPLLAPIGGISATSPTGVAAALFHANFYLYRTSGLGYFAPAVELNPLLHTWSLSVEEQFYFAIPVLLLVAWRLGRRRWSSLALIRALTGVLLVSSFVLCAWLSARNGTVWRVNGQRFAFYSPLTRAWEFAAGLALVLVPVRFLTGARLRPVLVTVGLVMIGVAALAYSDSTVFPGVAAFVPVAGTALVIHAGTRAGFDTETPMPTPTSLRPMTWMGDLSYSWYLWHWPLIVFAGAFWPGAGSVPLVVAAAASLAPAWLSYRWLEQRLRAGSTTQARPTLALTACCIVAPLLAAGLARPIESFIDRRANDSFRAVADTDPTQPGERECNSATPLGRRSPGTCSWGDPAAPESVVLVGDSNAAQFSDTLIGAADATASRLQIATLGGCPFTDLRYEMLPGVNQEVAEARCSAFVEGTVEALEAQPPDVVVIASSTDLWVYRDTITLVDPTTAARVESTGAKARLIEDSLVRLMDRLRAAGSKVVLVDIVPKPYSFDVRSCSNLAILVDATRCLPSQFPIDTHEALRKANLLQARAASRAGADTWNFNALICPDGQCRPMRDGSLVWRDPAHISAATAGRLAPQAGQYLDEVLASADDTG